MKIDFKAKRKKFIFNLTYKLIADDFMKEAKADVNGKIVAIPLLQKRRTYKHRFAEIYWHEWYAPSPEHPMCKTRCTIVPCFEK